MALKLGLSNFGIQRSRGGRMGRMKERESTLFSKKEISRQPLTSLLAIDSLIQLCLLISLQASLSVAVGSIKSNFTTHYFFQCCFHS